VSTNSSSKKQSIVTEKDISLILRVVKSNWWVPVVILPILYFAGMFYAYKQISVYEAYTSLLLNHNDTYYQNNVVSENSFYSSSSYVDNINEKRVIESYDLMQKTVDALFDRLSVSYYIIGKVRTTEQFSGNPFKVNVRQIRPDLYEQRFDFKILNFNQFQITYPGLDGKLIDKKGLFGVDLVDLDLNIRIDREPNLTETTHASLSQILYQIEIHSKDFLIGTFRSNLRTENPDYSNFINISLDDVLPERAMLVLDTLNSEYIKGRLKQKNDLNEKTVEYIDKQLNEITGFLNRYEDSLQGYKSRNAIIDLPWQQTNVLNKITGYETQLTELKLQGEALGDMEKYIIEDKDPQFLPPSIFIFEKGGYLSTAATELYQKQLQLNATYGLATNSNPVIIDLKNTIKKVKQDLLVYINNTRNASKKIEQNLKDQIDTYLFDAKVYPVKQRELLNIQRQATVNENLYNFLLEKRANTKISKASILPGVKIVEQPRNVGEVRPDKAAIQNSFITAGLIISLIIILLRAFFLSKIKTLTHLKELTEIPVVGVLPHIKNIGETGVIIEEQPNSKIAEAFRNFRTNLQYVNIGKQANSFLITSFSPGEGKTFTSVNLATVLAKAGKKTIILELDLHKPRVHKSLGLTQPKVGLSNYLIGQSDLNSIIAPSLIDNLTCLFAGPIPPNPSECVLSDKLRELIEYCKANYDYVVIDTPPAGLLSDAVYLMQYVDTPIFVLNTDYATKRVIDFIHGLTQNNGINNMVLTLNGVKNIGRRYYYKGYGYSYGYGYGYGYGKGYGYKK
jgi:capsular exopolysaccharide synthesis family protein